MGENLRGRKSFSASAGVGKQGDLRGRSGASDICSVKWALKVQSVKYIAEGFILIIKRCALTAQQTLFGHLIRIKIFLIESPR